MVNEQTDEQTIDDERLVATATALLSEHPQASVAAMNSCALSVPMPDLVPLRGHRILEGGRSLLDRVVPQDLTAAVYALHQALEVGAGEASVRLVNRPGQSFKVWFVDTRGAYGVLLAIVFPDDVGDAQAGAEAGTEIENSPPRYATLHQNDVGMILGCDEDFVRMFGWTCAELAGRSGLELIHPDDQSRAVEGWMAMLDTRRPQRERIRRLHKNGNWVWLDVTLHNFLGLPDRDYVLADVIDVSIEMAAQEALAAREHLLDRLAQALPVGLFQVAVDRRVIYSNERLHEILGTPATGDLDELLETVTDEYRPMLEETLTDVLSNTQGGADIEVDLLLPETGERRRCMVSSRALSAPDGGVTGAIVCVSDITDSTRMHLELEERARELEDKATFDTLTRCHNRGSAMAVLDQVLLERDAAIGVIFVDLDNFKAVNDLLGHAAGDELLVTVATRLKRVMRDEDIVGRIGGDEFLAVCQGVDGPEAALIVAQRITDTLLQEITLAAGTIDFSASIGVACSEPGISADALVARADEAMYHSKRQGKGLPVLYTSTLSALLGGATETPHRRSTRRAPSTRADLGGQGEHRTIAAMTDSHPGLC